MVLELIFGLICLMLWTLAYPLLRIRFAKTNRFKHHPSLLLFKSFVWVNKLFKKIYVKK
jgi:hypothetical protein